jgi:Fic family protein
MGYIYDLPEWPAFRWSEAALSRPLAAVRHRQGRLLGRMEALGFDLRAEASLRTLTQDAVKTSAIEGVMLDDVEVRSSLARRLGLDVAGLVPADRQVEGLVTMLLDATQNFDRPLTAARLFGWHAALFPTGGGGRRPIAVGAWRTDALGPMRVVSGPIGRERIHYEAPPARRVEAEMTRFFDWFEDQTVPVDPVVKAAVAHIWFVTIHPFDDGNGRIGRAIADLALARSETTKQRFYSMSARLRVERTAYYATLEAAQKGDLDITQRLAWFLQVLSDAIGDAEETLAAVLRKARFWESLSGRPINQRQRAMLNRLLDGFTGKLTSSKWAKIAKCSQDTALRDINDLVERAILVREEAGGRSTSYSLRS